MTLLCNYSILYVKRSINLSNFLYSIFINSKPWIFNYLLIFKLLLVCLASYDVNRNIQGRNHSYGGNFLVGDNLCAR